MVYDAGLGNTEKVSVCDLWHQKDLGSIKGNFGHKSLSMELLL